MPCKPRKPSKRDLERQREGELNRNSDHWALVRTTTLNNVELGTTLSLHVMKNALTAKELQIYIPSIGQIFCCSAPFPAHRHLLFLRGCSCEDHTARSRDCYHMAAYQALRDILAGVRPAKPKYRLDRKTGSFHLTTVADAIRGSREQNHA